MPGIGIADRYLMNFHRIVGLEVFVPHENLYFTGGALRPNLVGHKNIIGFWFLVFHNGHLVVK